MAPRKKPKKGGRGLPTLNYKKLGGDLTYDPISATEVSVDPFEVTDTTFAYNPLVAGTVTPTNVSAGAVTADQLANRFMTAADYTLVDPTKISQQYGDIARQQIRQNTALSSELALETLATELKGLQSFAPAAAALQRGEIAKDNAFNQAQRLAQLEQGDPRLKADLEAQAERARAFSEGRVPNAIQDRALELGIRSRAADVATFGGFGARSSAGRKASELMSAEQRIGLSQYGDQLLTANIGNRAQLLLSPTQYATGGSQIQATPTQSASQVAQNLLAQANDKTIISSETALANQTQQQQFKTGLEQETRQFNTNLAAQRDINQANLNLQAQSTNVESSLRADLANQATNLQAQTTNVGNALSAAEANARNQIQIRSTQIATTSQDRQFGAQLGYNVANANADRAFQAANINAGRALEVATSNRNLRFEIQRTNKQMIFQDQQARKAEAAANARAAMAARASSGAAALNAQVQREALAANIQLQRESMAFQLQQQALATDAAREGIDLAHQSQNSATAGQIISRAPAIIAGVSSTAAAISDIYNSFYGPEDGATSTPSSLDTQASFDVPSFGYDSGYEADYAL